MDSLVENIFVNKELYSVLFAPVCSKYELTMAEMLVLLFLEKNSCQDTASDIVDKLKITKSHVSASVRDLMERGYLRGSHIGRNHRTIHLQLCEGASEIVREGRQAQEAYLSIVSRGFTDEERSAFRRYIQRMTDNANDYLKGCLSPRRS